MLTDDLEKSRPFHRIQIANDTLQTRISDFLCGNFSKSSNSLREDIVQRIFEEDFLVISIAHLCSNLEIFRESCIQLSELLGALMVQNDAGDTVIEVFNRNVGRIEQGARYHQTRQGGDIHTDSVNRIEPMKYLVLGCAAPALIGGETILLRAQDVVDELAHLPDVLNILRSKFYFEGRGMSSDVQLFELPVLSEKDGKPRFRYLRSYIASAHERAGEPLTADQEYAFDVLDSVLETSSLQYRVTLRAGDILIAEDTSVFHGRTSFVDGPVPGGWAPRRHMLRCWIS